MSSEGDRIRALRNEINPETGRNYTRQEAHDLVYGKTETQTYEVQVSTKSSTSEVATQLEQQGLPREEAQAVAQDIVAETRPSEEQQPQMPPKTYLEAAVRYVPGFESMSPRERAQVLAEIERSAKKGEIPLAFVAKDPRFKSLPPEERSKVLSGERTLEDVPAPVTVTRKTTRQPTPDIPHKEFSSEEFLKPTSDPYVLELRKARAEAIARTFEIMSYPEGTMFTVDGKKMSRSEAAYQTLKTVKETERLEKRYWKTAAKYVYYDEQTGTVYPPQAIYDRQTGAVTFVSGPPQQTQLDKMHLTPTEALAFRISHGVTDELAKPQALLGGASLRDISETERQLRAHKLQKYEVGRQLQTSQEPVQGTVYSPDKLPQTQLPPRSEIAEITREGYYFWKPIYDEEKVVYRKAGLAIPRTGLFVAQAAVVVPQVARELASPGALAAAGYLVTRVVKDPVGSGAKATAAVGAMALSAARGIKEEPIVFFSDVAFGTAASYLAFDAAAQTVHKVRTYIDSHTPLKVIAEPSRAILFDTGDEFVGAVKTKAIGEHPRYTILAEQRSLVIADKADDIAASQGILGVKVVHKTKPGQPIRAETLYYRQQGQSILAKNIDENTKVFNVLSEVQEILEPDEAIKGLTVTDKGVEVEYVHYGPTYGNIRDIGGIVKSKITAISPDKKAIEFSSLSLTAEMKKPATSMVASMEVTRAIDLTDVVPMPKELRLWHLLHKYQPTEALGPAPPPVSAAGATPAGAGPLLQQTKQQAAFMSDAQMSQLLNFIAKDVASKTPFTQQTTFHRLAPLSAVVSRGSSYESSDILQMPGQMPGEVVSPPQPTDQARVRAMLSLPVAAPPTSRSRSQAALAPISLQTSGTRAMLKQLQSIAFNQVTSEVQPQPLKEQLRSVVSNVQAGSEGASDFQLPKITETLEPVTETKTPPPPPPTTKPPTPIFPDPGQFVPPRPAYGGAAASLLPGYSKPKQRGFWEKKIKYAPSLLGLGKLVKKAPKTSSLFNIGIRPALAPKPRPSRKKSPAPRKKKSALTLNLNTPSLQKLLSFGRRKK